MRTGGFMLRHLSIALAFFAMIFFSQASYGSYKSELNKCTKKDRIYSFENLDAQLSWNATFFSDNFRHEYEKEHIRRMHLEASDADQFMSEQEHEQSSGWEFFIGLYTQKSYEKFSSGVDSFWKIHIETESGEKIYPTSIEMVPLTAYERVMFKYLNRWMKGYRVVFPKVDIGKKFKLCLYSIVGDSTLTWNLK
jgi:hypothetical protein